MMLVLAITLLMLAAACRQTERPPFLPPPEPVPPPEMMWNVKTDYSNLTPYVPPFTMHTRLHDGPLPELIPSTDYGTLLPYASAAIMPDGGLRESKFGFVTMDGVVVTDLVFDQVNRAYEHIYHYSGLQPYPLPQAYWLTVNMPVSGQSYSESKQAACALDGSWITPFDYVNIVFTRDVIMLMRSHDTYDVDVRDYSGRLLYNMLDMEWAGKLSGHSWPGELVYSVSEGYGSVQLPDGTCAFIDIRTGAARYTEYAMAHPFSEGFASVAINTGSFGPVQQLWGFIDSDFELVIPHMYVVPAMFKYGRAVVQFSDDTQHVIDKRGQTLFVVPSGAYMDHNYSGPGFVLYGYDREGYSNTFYTIDLQKINMPQIALTAYSLEYLANEWYGCNLPEGYLLFNQDREIFLPGVGNILLFDGEVMVYYEYTEDYGSQTGVRTLDGRDIIPAKQEVTITAVTRNGALEAFVVNTHSGYSFGYGKDPEYRQSGYWLVDTDGELIVSGYGMMSHNEAEGLISVLGADHFAWLDLEGNVIISIPHMSYMMD